MSARGGVWAPRAGGGGGGGEGRGRGRGTSGRRSRGRGSFRGAGRGMRAASPDTFSSVTATAMTGARDPTKAADRLQYMKYMGDLFQKLKDGRESERKSAIRDGFLADPEKKTTLAEAITPVGTCQAMCPEFERVERIVQHAVDKCERNSGPDNKVAWEPFMVKRFRRSAAGTDDQIPSDIRPPLVLKKTLDYLLNRVVGGPEPLAAVHKFVWDRTRAIRNDFSIQQVTKVEDLKVAIECFERIARFHLLALHQLSHPTRDNGDFDAHQEREQLGNTLLSLMYYYDDSRKKFASPNEAEFRAYGIIFEIQDRRPDIEHRVQTWPKDLLQDPRVQTALKLYAAASNVDDSQGPLNPRTPFAIAQANFGRFWSIIRLPSVSYLAACAAEIYFNYVRSTALATIYKSYRRPGGMDDMTLEVLSDWLGFDNEDQTQRFCEEHGFTVKERESGVAYVDLSSVSTQWLNDSNSARRQIFSRRLVEAKRHGRILPAVIKGYNVARCKAEGLLDAGQGDLATDDNLFLSDDDQQKNIQARAGQPQPTATLANPFAKSDQGQPQPNPFAKTNQGQTSFNPFAPQAASPNPFASTASSTASGFTANSSPFPSQQDQKTNPFAKFATPSSSTQPNPTTSDSPFTISATNQTTKNPFPNPFQSSSAAEAKALATPAPSNPFFHSAAPSQLQSANSIEKAQQAQQDTKSSLATNNNGPQLLPLKEQQPLPDSKPLFQFTPPTSSLSASSMSAKKVQFADAADDPSASPPQLFPSQSDQQQAASAADTQSTEQLQQAQEGERRRKEAEEARKRQEEEARRAEHERKRQEEEERQRREQEVLAKQKALERQKQRAAEALALKKRQEENRSQVLDTLAYKYTTGAQGVLHMFLEMLVQPIAEKYVEKMAREQEKARVAEARQRFLAVKYVKRWRTISYNRSLARSAKARRKRMAEARQEGWRSRGTSRASSVTSAEIDDVPLGSLLRAPMSITSAKSETTTGKRRSFPPGFHSSSQRTAMHADNQSEIAREVKKMKLGQHSRSQTVTGSMPPPSTTPRKSRQEAVLSRSTDRLLYSQALPNESVLKKARRLVTGRTDNTHTDYFRLKSMGVDPDTPVVPETRKRPRTSDHAEDMARQSSRARTSPSPPAALARYSSRSSSRLPADSEPAPSPALSAQHGDDDELFAKVREVRRAMAESEEWFKSTRHQYEDHQASASLRGRSSERPPSAQSTPSRTSIRHQMSGSHGYLERWEQIQQRRAAEAAAEAAEAAEPEEIWFGSSPSNEDLESPSNARVNGARFAAETLKPPPEPFGGKSGASVEDAIEL